MKKYILWIAAGGSALLAALVTTLLFIFVFNSNEPAGVPDEGTHTCIGATWITEKVATCQGEGSKKNLCSCGKTVRIEAIPLGNHKEITVPGKPATCKEKGLTDGKKCSVCGETLAVQTEIPLAEHNEETVPGKAATCDEPGLTDGKKCTICGMTLIEQVEIPLGDHNMKDGKCAVCYYPYIPISSVEDLKNISLNLSENYILLNDLDLGGMEWTPIGIGTSTNNRFTGSFDGNGCVISNFKITDSVEHAGLFGYNRGTIKNLGLEDFIIDVSCSSYIFAGGLVGINSSGTISDCYAIGEISGSGVRSYTGGLIGQNSYGTVTKCCSMGTVSGTSSGNIYVGGLVGDNSFGTITKCYSTGIVNGASSGDACVGGLVGYNEKDSIITKSYSTGMINGTSSGNVYAGGLVGCGGGTIANCYGTGDVSAFGYYAYAGGLAGYNDEGTVTNCYSTGDISSTSSGSYYYACAGGLIGYNECGTITNCYAMGELSSMVSDNHSYAYVGGLVAYNDRGTITNSYRYSGQSFTVTQNGTTTYEATNTDGTAADMPTLQSVNFLQNTLGWSVDNWSFTNGAHPTLKNAGLSN